MMPSHYNDNVFINCPFDIDYKPLLDAIVFTVYDCGFIVRCALEEEDASQVRIDKIYNIISDCRYGIHDISRTEIDNVSGFPRFNMPFELGVFLGAKKFGGEEQKRKTCLILDRKPYRYQEFISDIAGQDIQTHNNTPEQTVRVVRNWLRTASKREMIPDGSIIWQRYKDFIDGLPIMAQFWGLDANNLIYNDYTWMVVEWLRTKENRLSQHLYGGGD